MKLRLPLFLLSFILSIPAAMPAAADVIGAGVFYDVGKVSFSSDDTAKMPEGSKLTSDKWYCWAGAGANATQYWQDFYYIHKDETADVPNGIVDGGGYGQPTGTAYTQVYQKTLELGKMDTNGSPASFYEWWFKGGELETVLGYKPAYYSETFKGKEVAKTLPADYWGELTLEDFSNFVVETFKTPGQSVSLSIVGTANHAISCWGYELDPETNMVSALLLSDTDDKRFSVFRVNVEVRDCYADMSMYLEEGTYQVAGEQISLVTDELAGYYGHDWTWVTEACAIQTPEGTKPDEDDAPKMKDTLSAGDTVTKNTTLAASTAITGAGVVVGNGESTIVVTTKAPEVSLTMDGTIEGGGKSPQTGMKINDGGTVSLQDFTVENYGVGGVETTGRLYLHNGDVKIADNETSGAGGGINNTSYVEIQDADTVSFTGNSAEGKGGAINNVNPAGKPTIDTLAYLVKGEAPPSIGLEDEHPTYTTVSLRGNGEVVFSGNSATAGGNDIYNGEFAVVNIADNANVTFKGAEGEDKTVAIQNDGYLFLSAKEGHSIDFAGSTLESKGATAIGMDANGWTTDAKGEVAFYDNPDKTGGRLSLSSQHELGKMTFAYEDEFFGPMATREYTIPALLKNVSVNADVIMGLGATPVESSVTDTLIRTNNPLAISKLTMNTTDSIVSTSLGDVALDTVVFDLTALTGADIVDRKVDLTQMLTGNYTFSKVHFLMSDEISEEELKNLTFDLSTAYTEAEEAQIKEQIKLYSNGKEIATDNVTFMFAENRVPEPTTGTLSLLALAALAARRRRKG